MLDDAVLDGARGVPALELGVEMHAGLRREALEFEHRRAADGFEDVEVVHLAVRRWSLPVAGYAFGGSVTVAVSHAPGGACSPA